MRAVLCQAYGPPEQLVLADIASPMAEQGQVVIDIKACSVSFPDILLITDKYQFKPPLPFSPGGELAGVIKEVGPGVQQWKVGDRVIAFSGWGGFAEEIAVDANHLFPLPASMDFIAGSVFVMTYATSYYALRDRAQIKSGETLLVLGAAGGVGLATIELGKIMGARVIAAASTEEKLAICRQHGADEVVNYTSSDLKESVKTLTNGKGVDVIFDPVGGALAEPALRSIAWGGRYLVVGFAAGDIPRIPLNLTLLKGASIVGVFWWAFADRDPTRNRAYLQEILDLYNTGKIKPHISAIYPLAQAADALRAMAQRKVIGKVTLLIDES